MQLLCTRVFWLYFFKTKLRIFRTSFSENIWKWWMGTSDKNIFSSFDLKRISQNENYNFVFRFLIWNGKTNLRKHFSFFSFDCWIEKRKTKKKFFLNLFWFNIGVRKHAFHLIRAPEVSLDFSFIVLKKNLNILVKFDYWKLHFSNFQFQF